MDEDKKVDKPKQEKKKEPVKSEKPKRTIFYKGKEYEVK